MNKLQEKRETAVQAFRREIAELRPLLPGNWKELFIQENPEYDSLKGSIILHNVINGRSTDPAVLAGIKKIIEKLK